MKEEDEHSRIPKPLPTWLPASAAQATTPVPDSKLRWPGWGSVSPKSGRQQQEAPKTIHTTMEGVLPSAELIKAAWRNSPTPTLMPLPQQRLQLFAVSTAPPSGLHIYTTGDEVVQSAAAVCSAAAQMLPQLLTSQQPRLTQLKAEASHVDVPVDVSHVARAEDNACAASHVKQDLQRESWAVDEDGRTPENWLCPLPLPQSQVEVSNAQGRCSLRSEGLRPVQSVLQRCSINDSVPSTGHPRLEKLTLLEQQAHLEGCLGKELSQSGYELDHEGALQQLEMLSAELERLRTPVKP